MEGLHFHKFYFDNCKLKICIYTGAEDENVPFLVLKYGANFAEIQRNTALVLSQIQQNSAYIF